MRGAKIATVRRSLAGLLFGLASIVASLAVSGFWLNYTAFSPGHTRSTAHAVLQDKAIKTQIATLIANSTATQLGQNPADVKQLVLSNINRAAGAELLAGVVSDAQAKLIGASDKPVQITPAQMVPLVGNEVAMTAPTVTLPIKTVPALSAMRKTLKWLVPIAAILAAILLVLGFAAHPEKAELLRSLGILLIAIAALLIVLGFIVPSYILPLLTKNPWIGVAPRLAADSLPLLLALALVAAGIGLGCLAAAAASKRRDRWSQPIRRTSYREERRWS
jgi:hypothetical protein